MLFTSLKSSVSTRARPNPDRLSVPKPCPLTLREMTPSTTGATSRTAPPLPPLELPLPDPPFALTSAPKTPVIRMSDAIRMAPPPPAPPRPLFVPPPPEPPTSGMMSAFPYSWPSFAVRPVPL